MAEDRKRTRGGNDAVDDEGGKRTKAGGGEGGGDDRNKRLFGALMFGHLSKAKTTLERDATLIERRKTVENKRAAEQEKLASTLHQMERKVAESERSERSKHEVQVRLDALKRRQTDVMAAGKAYKAKLMPLAAVLLTKTTPQLQWLPATHTAATKELLEARVEKIEAEIRSREEDDVQLMEDLEEDIRALQQTLHGDDEGEGDGNDGGGDGGQDKVTLSEYKARMQTRREEREEALNHVDLRETLRGSRGFGSTAWGGHGQGFNDSGRGSGGNFGWGYGGRGDRNFAPQGSDLRDLREPQSRRRIGGGGGDYDEWGRDRRGPTRHRDEEDKEKEGEGMSQKVEEQVEGD